MRATAVWSLVAGAVIVAVVISGRGIDGQIIGKDRCDDNTPCPEDSTCSPKGCDGNVCLCNDGFVPTPDSAECKIAVDLRQPCGNENQRCRAIHSFCNENKLCSCTPDYVESLDALRCKPRSFFPPTTYSLFGEPCGGDVRCTGQDVVCSTDLMCECNADARVRPATEEELQAAPFNPFPCRPVGFALDNTTVPCPTPEPPAMSDIDENCLSYNNCPENSACLPRGCDGRVCVCESGYRATPDNKQCLTAVPLGGDCSGNDTICARSEIETQCSVNGTCVCMEGFEERNGRCRHESTIIPPSLVTRFALLGETCGLQVFGRFMYYDVCGDPYTECNNTERVCECKPGFRPANDVEKESDPDRESDCVHQSYSLEVADLSKCHDIARDPPTPAPTMMAADNTMAADMMNG